jgi:ribonuclease Z
MQLHAVWVSHMHADHHGGLYPLLLRRQALLQQHQQEQQRPDSAPAAATGSDTADGRDQASAAAAAGGDSVKPLLILGPFPLFRVLCQYSKVLPLAFTFLPNHSFFSPNARQPPAEALAAYEAVKAAAGLSLLQPFPVQHVANSSGLQVQSERGWKVVFSGEGSWVCSGCGAMESVLGNLCSTAFCRSGSCLCLGPFGGVDLS